MEFKKCVSLKKIRLFFRNPTNPKFELEMCRIYSSEMRRHAHLFVQFSADHY
jgi:hypothetical protein